MNKLCLLWGRPECEAYISGLIMDSRDGKRQGLPWEAAMGVPFPQMLKRLREASPG